MKKREINALVNLLDDPDKKIFSHVKEKLLSLGEDAIPLLENAWESSLDPLQQDRIENIIHKIQFENIIEGLKKWYLSDAQDLFSGTVLIARYQYPDLDENKLRLQIEKIRQDIWLELNDNLTSFEKVHVINRILFDLHGFSGNTQNFHAPQNSYINNVIESKKGNPLLLSVLYIIVARSLMLPVYGVNLPRHFVLAYLTDEGSVLFYINPFSKGTVFNKGEIDHFLKQLHLKPDGSYYKPCTNIEMIKRVLINLNYSYTRLGHEDKIAEIGLLMNVVYGEKQ